MQEKCGYFQELISFFISLEAVRVELIPNSIQCTLRTNNNNNNNRLSIKEESSSIL